MLAANNLINVADLVLGMLDGYSERRLIQYGTQVVGCVEEDMDKSWRWS